MMWSIVSILKLHYKSILPNNFLEDHLVTSVQFHWKMISGTTKTRQILYCIILIYIVVVAIWCEHTIVEKQGRPPMIIQSSDTN